MAQTIQRAQLSIFVYILVAPTLSPTARADYFSERRNLANVYVHENDILRVFYDTTGTHAVNPTDTNTNGVPDLVEDVAKQSWAAYHLFTDSLGFQDPLESERYSNAAYIDINMLSQSTLGGNNGIAYDGLNTFNRPIDPVDTFVITFDVATSVDPISNVTPTHEMFHLVQNGYTFFKTRWYTEGMARWSEHALDSGGLGSSSYNSEGPWPQTDADQQDLFSRTYSSEFYFWNPLASLDDSAGVIPVASVNSTIANLTYTGTGENVLEDFELVGTNFIREVLEELAIMDDIAFKWLGYESWAEANQKSLANSPYIYQAVLDVARRRGHDIGPYSVVPAPGDFNGNGEVDMADLSQWIGDFGLNDESDSDYDGDSDGADFLAWQRHFGITNSNNSAALTTVPEPANLATFIMSLISSSMFSHWRYSRNART